MSPQTANRKSFGPVELFAPLTPAEFLDSYWEKQLLHIADRSPDHYSTVFSIRDVDAALLPVRSATSDTAARPVNKDKPDSGEQGSFYRRFLDGSTININFVDLQFPGLNILCRRLEQFFHFPCGSNLYLTPPDSQGFAAHYDRHDVLVLHIYGEKRWDVWPADFRPLRDETRPVPDRSGEPRKILLRPGDLLYLPRGFVHQAYAEQTTTLHLSVRIEPLRWLDLAFAAVRQSVADNPALRASLPVRFLHNDAIADTWRRQLEGTLGHLVDRKHIDAAVRALGRQVTANLTPTVDNRFEILGNLHGLHADSIVGAREGSLAFMETVNENLNLCFSGNTLTMPRRIQPAMEFILANERFRVDAIPGLDGASQVVLVRKLIKAGYLTILS